MKLTLAVTMVAGAVLAGPVLAQDFPTRPVTWVVPFTPGGITDMRSRLIAESFGEALGQQVIVENRPGAGGTVGTEYVARTPADGYTLIYGSLGILAAAPALYADLQFDPLEDFDPVHMMGQTPNTILVSNNAPFASIEELVEYGRANPGAITAGSAGVSTGTHLALELFAGVAGIEVLHVPYQGSAPAMNDLLAGRIDMLLDYPTSSAAHVEAGSVRLLAVTGSQRAERFPDIPTIAEAGYPEATTGSWSGVWAAAGTPPERLAILRDAFAQAMETEAVMRHFRDAASEPMDYSPEEMNAFLESELERWQQIIADAGIEAQ